MHFKICNFPLSHVRGTQIYAHCVCLPQTQTTLFSVQYARCAWLHVQGVWNPRANHPSFFSKRGVCGVMHGTRGPYANFTCFPSLFVDFNLWYVLETWDIISPSFWDFKYFIIVDLHASITSTMSLLLGSTLCFHNIYFSSFWSKNELCVYMTPY